jgi:hypothetical protein
MGGYAAKGALGVGAESGMADLSRPGFFKLCFVTAASSILVAAGCGGEEDEEDDD